MTSVDFDRLCDGPLASAIAGLEGARQTAMQRFGWIMVGAGALGLVAAFLVPGLAFKAFILFFVLVVGYMVASVPLSRAARTLKEPALIAIGQARGLSHQAGSFSADGYDAIHPLFGRPGGRTFRDRFEGDDNGRRFILYEASLVSGSGKSRRDVFNGLIFNVARRPVQGETVVIPDRGLFNFFSPGRGMERVRFEDDPTFEQGLEVYSTRPDEARALINPVVREQLKTWRSAHGKVIVRLAGDQATVALASPGDRFEVGSMFQSIPGRERVRVIWDDLEEALGLMRQITGTLG